MWKIKMSLQMENSICMEENWYITMAMFQKYQCYAFDAMYCVAEN